jgi:hypothetical protein
VSCSVPKWKSGRVLAVATPSTGITQSMHKNIPLFLSSFPHSAWAACSLRHTTGSSPAPLPPSYKESPYSLFP